MVSETKVRMTEEQEILELLGYPVTAERLDKVRGLLFDLSYEEHHPSFSMSASNSACMKFY